ncbi:cGMP-dependent protein kinase 1 [Synchiropus splendidus]|uniref:cGMP-dependent protein kinase 1 n=1 Tax=Synchiropus splendidus TaxID=270530 RepID=UPI00237DF7BF|nr:cGMP-dependent protein kinase 1 [Synchiropus splendidus]
MGTLRDLQFALQLKIEELRQRDALIDELELELDTKDELIRRLQEELDRYRTAGASSCPTFGSEVCLDPVERRATSRRKTVLPEFFSLDPEPVNESLRTIYKNPESQRIIQAAFLRNDLLKNLEEEEMLAVISRMHPISIHQGCQVIQEGTSGAQAFVLEEGRMEVSKAGVKQLTIVPEDMFGEDALLYQCTHSSTVSAQTECRLWVSDRHSFKRVLMESGLRRMALSLEQLCSVPCLQLLPEEVIMNLAELMHQTHYTEGDVIVRQGCSADTLYIIIKGQVKVSEKNDGEERLYEGHWFGEEALSGEHVYGVNVLAAGDVTCWSINRQTLKDITSECLVNSKQRMFPNTESKVQSASYCRSLQRSPSKESSLLDTLSSCSLTDFHVICTLGLGEFGHVDLVQLKSPVKSLYAMKVLKKTLIVPSSRRELLMRERRILPEAACPFIVSFHKTFRDAECLYVLMEACLHGDLHCLLRERGFLDERSCRFYTACVAEALTFLHRERVVYRDVKPENVLLDERGYAKLTSSRCLKKMEVGKRTYSFCGTPGYIAPEIILGHGHSFAADFWSLGVLVFELLSGRLPFSGPDLIKTLSAAFSSTGHIDFPKEMSAGASSLVKQLCRLNPTERLGGGRNWAKDIRRHTWFEGFDWDGLAARTLNPPAAAAPQAEHLLDSTCGQYTGDATELDSTWENF